MKAVFPKNIKKGLLSGLTFSMGPISISIIQLFIVAGGIAIAVVVFTKVWETSKVGGIFFAVLILLIFIVLAFFKISELWIVAFFSKMIKDNFLDTKEKFQTNYKKNHPIDLSITRFKSQEKKQKIEFKTLIDHQDIWDLDLSGLL